MTSMRTRTCPSAGPGSAPVHQAEVVGRRLAVPAGRQLPLAGGHGHGPILLPARARVPPRASAAGLGGLRGGPRLGPCSSSGPRPRWCQPEDALPGRPEALPNMPEVHAVNGNRIQPPFPEGMQTAVFGASCSGGWRRSSGKPPGSTRPRPGTRAASRRTRRTRRSARRARAHRGRPGRLRTGGGLLRAAAEGVLGGARPDAGHAPGQRHRHPVPLGDLRLTGPSRRPPRAPAGTRTRSAWTAAGYGEITTEIEPLREFFYAEDYHQQYLYKVPHGTAR